MYLYFALAKIGAIPVLCLPPHRQTEIAYLAELSGAVAYAIPDTYRGFDYLSLARAVRECVPTIRTVLVAGEAPDAGTTSFAELLDTSIENDFPPTHLDRLRPDPREAAVFLLSGGTTGLPKLIPRTHDDYVYNSKQSAKMSRLDRETVFLAATPVAHNFTLACPGVQATMLVGGRVVLSASTDPAEIFSLIQQERVTCASAVPAMAIAWMNSPLLAQYDLSSLKLLLTGGSKFNPEVARRVRPGLGCELQQILGMAEGLLTFTRLNDPEEWIYETVGRPISPDDEIQIVDDAGEPVAPGEPGELLARGPYTIRGYYRAPEHNQQAFTPDGFYRTGDVVYQDAHGNLIVAGRKKDMINRGGEKISAEEVENLILAHPAVQNVAVVAMPDPLLGERACAYVILHPGATLSLPELVAFLGERQIARFKLPERLEVVEQFPLTTVGKISKKDLRADIADKLSGQVQG
ncbi:MAG: AMP-binding protein [Dehalococcoidia bacterium]|nr:AMP-binding protein [Dehalococcoidia bacterium]